MVASCVGQTFWITQCIWPDSTWHGRFLVRHSEIFFSSNDMEGAHSKCWPIRQGIPAYSLGTGVCIQKLGFLSTSRNLVIRLSLLHRTSRYCGHVTRIQSDNDTALAYVNHQGSTRSQAARKEAVMIMVWAELIQISHSKCGKLAGGFSQSSVSCFMGMVSTPEGVSNLLPQMVVTSWRSSGVQVQQQNE